MAPKLRPADRQVVRIASRQHGVITIRQLLAAGLSREAVKSRVERGLLHREFRGVYRVGHRARRPKAPGAWKLHGIFEGQRITLSELERLFVELLRSAGLPLPLTNRPAGGRYVDCRWPEHKLTVELLSYRYHHTRHAWEQDHHRKREARARGDAFRTYTWDDVTEHREETLAELPELLSTAATSTRSASASARGGGSPGSAARAATGSGASGRAPRGGPPRARLRSPGSRPGPATGAS